MERNGSPERATRMPANANCAPTGRDAGSETDAAERLDEVVLIIARLIGRRMAREDYKKAMRAANDNALPARDGAGPVSRTRTDRTEPSCPCRTLCPLFQRQAERGSIEDQFRLCREHAGRERWQIVGSYEDAAISGASTILCPGSG